MNKMVLVPETHVEELKRLRLYQRAKLPPKPEIIQTVDIQKNIDELMTDPNISATEKMHRYGEYMLKYNSFKDQAIDTSELAKAPTYTPDILKPVSVDNVITSIPKTMQIPIKNLLEQLKGHTNVTWDDKGIVSINGKIIIGSNITDIMNDAARERKSRTNAVGWLDVAEELVNKNKNINVGNKRWSNLVNKELINKRKGNIINTPSGKRPLKKKQQKRILDAETSFTDDNYDDDDQIKSKKLLNW